MRSESASAYIGIAPTLLMGWEYEAMNHVKVLITRELCHPGNHIQSTLDFNLLSFRAISVLKNVTYELSRLSPSKINVITESSHHTLYTQTHTHTEGFFPSHCCLRNVKISFMFPITTVLLCLYFLSAILLNLLPLILLN